MSHDAREELKQGLLALLKKPLAPSSAKYLIMNLADQFNATGNLPEPRGPEPDWPNIEFSARVLVNIICDMGNGEKLKAELEKRKQQC